MRIVHVYKDVYPPTVGGIERHIDSIRHALPELVHDVLACSRELRTRTDHLDGGREVLVGELGRVLSTPVSPAFPLWLGRLAAGAIIHLHMPNPMGELSALARRLDAPLVVTYHSDIFRQRALLPLYRPVILRTLRAADSVIAASERLRVSSSLLRESGAPVDVVPFGVQCDFWAAENAHPLLVTRLRARYGAQHVIAVGRLVGYKGFDVLVRAARSLPWPVVIVGEGGARGRLERQIRRLGLGDRVHLVGRVDDRQLAAHLAAAEIFVLPAVNRAESFGIALLEAQAAGLPVIATDVGTGTVEAFDPGGSGIPIPANDERALVQAVCELIRDPARRRAMGDAGRARVRARNSLRVFGEGMGRVYERVSSGP